MWQSVLINAIKDPKLAFIKSNCAVVIKDKYPKAKHNFLVLPEEDITSIYALQKKHMDLLEELELLATNVIEVIGEKRDNFKVGYHAVPSLNRLHLHVISKDFESLFLKTKKHWNSFNTEFFIDAERIREELQESGIIARLPENQSKALLNAEIACNKCGEFFSTMPKLKEHLHSNKNH